MSAWVAWFVGCTVVAVLLVIDLYRLGGEGSEVATATALRWSALWLAVGVGFTAVVWVADGQTLAGQYLGGYMVERVLSVDNLAVLLLVLENSAVSEAARGRALRWGLFGAIALRAVLVVAGIALLTVVPGLAAILGIALILTGVGLCRSREQVGDGPPSWLERVLAGRTGATAGDGAGADGSAGAGGAAAGYSGQAVWVRDGGRWRMTPVFWVMAAVMVADVASAFDSVPAVLSFSRAIPVVVAANGLAVLGLKPLYFLVSGLVERLRYLKFGLGLVLAIAGSRLIADEFTTVPSWLELTAVLFVLVVTGAASLVAERNSPSTP